MSIEQQGQGPMRNAAGEEVRPTQLKSGEVRYITQAEFHQLVDQGEIDVPHSGETVLREYRQTPLQVAHDTGLTRTPDSLAAMPRTSNRSNKLALRVGGAAAALLATAGVIGGVVANNGDNENSRSEAPSSASATPGGETTTTPEVVSGAGGVTLTSEQMDILLNGDFESQSELINQSLLVPIHEAFRDYANGTADSIDISSITSNPIIAQNFYDTLTSHWPDFEEKRAAGLQEVGVCNANMPSPDAIGSGCEERFSEIYIDQPIVLDVARSTYEPGTFAEIPEDYENLAATRPEFHSDTIVPRLNGNVLSLEKR